VELYLHFPLYFHGEVLNKAQKHANITRDIVTCVSFKSETKLQETFTYVTSLRGT
jgi:hypothetical protein